MNNYFLGFFPDENSNHKIRRVVGEVGRVFSGQDIDVRFVKPQTFHITLLFLGSNINFISRILLNNRLKNLIIPKFTMNFHKCELGISRQHRGLIYLTTKDGGEHLRNLVFNLRNLLKIQDSANYIPHLTLGRVNKDLTDQEYKNLSADLKNINDSLKLGEIHISSENMNYVKSENGNYTFLKKFETA